MHDLVLVGGGLAACLIAHRLAARRPELDIVVLESGPRLGGNHTWSFFPTDVTGTERAWLEPFIEYRWPHYEVRFPSFRRTLDTGYCTMTSDRLHAVMAPELGDRARFETRVERLAPDGVELADGTWCPARAVIDARGPGPSEHLILGFQKFTGTVVRLESPHGLTGPIVMDATVPQQGDYRFFYALPFTERELLVEDTRYSDHPDLDEDADRSAIAAYLAEQGWTAEATLRTERGVLPVTLGGDIAAFWSEGPRVPRVGLRGALFHATTGYSFATAVRLADALTQVENLGADNLYRFVRGWAERHWQRQRYLRLLNRMLFLAAAPDARYRVMARFYRLPQPLIERFYAGRLTFGDRVRILTGRPPVAILPALRCLPEASAAHRQTGVRA